VERNKPQIRGFKPGNGKKWLSRNGGHPKNCPFEKHPKKPVDLGIPGDLVLDIPIDPKR
jgi:hypothetical protein